MRFTSFVAAAAFITSALAANFDVNVGESNTFTFNPTSITGVVAGDTVTFHFLTRNHSATTTTFTTPCPPPDGGVPGGFDTGFHDATSGVPPPVVVPITSDSTQWVACRQAGGAHCRLGMTFAINPTTSQTYEQFLDNALHS